MVAPAGGPSRVAAAMTHEGYQVSVVAEWFHIVPHVDIGFAPVNSTFDPSSNVYLEVRLTSSDPA